MEINSLPDASIFEYLLVIRPHESLQERILHIRKDFHEQFLTDQPLLSTPQVGLVRFEQYEQLQEKWMRRVHLFSMGASPFKVELRDFCSTPTHTISFNIATKIPIQDFIRSIRTEAQQLLKRDEDHTPHFLLEPHIPVAQKLLPWQFEKGWMYMQHQNFNASFIAEHLLVLRRKKGSRSFFPLQQFKLMNLVSSRQGNLFM